MWMDPAILLEDCINWVWEWVVLYATAIWVSALGMARNKKRIYIILWLTVLRVFPTKIRLAPFIPIYFPFIPFHIVAMFYT